MDNIIYRRVLPNESKLYREIRLESLKRYPNSFGSSYEQENIKAKLSFEQYIEESNVENFIIGAFEVDQLIGLCGFFRLKDKRCQHRGGIIQMYVKAKHQNKGIGYSLLKETIDEAFKIDGLEQIELGVMTNLPSAHKIYEKVGFTELGIQQHFLKIDDSYIDHSLMVLDRKSL